MMAGFHKDKAQEVFNIPEDFEPLALLPLAEKETPTHYPMDTQSKKRPPGNARASRNWHLAKNGASPLSG